MRKNSDTTITNWDSLPVVFDLLTVSLVFGVTETTVKNWLKAGHIKGKKIGHQWFFEKSYIKSLVEIDLSA